MGVFQQRDEGEDDDLGIEVAGAEPLLEGDDEDLVIDLADWDDTARAALQGRLEEVGLRHSWDDDGGLVVGSADEAWVDRLIEQVEDQVTLELDPGATQVAYDLSEWDDDERGRLLDAVVAESIAHGWDGTELYVQEDDEDRVDQLVDSILDPAAVLSDDDGHALLSKLFVAGDRLRHDPSDREGTASLAEAAEAAEGSAPPYGVDRAVWKGIAEQATGLARLLAADDPDGDAVIAAADALRGELRQYV
ncbi:MAG: hypothetical protein AB7L84_02900 [Acidimicrobiia bacterium]